MEFLAAPLLLQALGIFFDEFYFHHKRGLPKWEIIGHPLDSLSVALCFFFAYFVTYTPLHLSIYIGLSVFSCLFVTKDEFVHTDLCEWKENWLHACLFILHPLCFLVAGIWWSKGLYASMILTQGIMIMSFMFYQIIYWSFRWPKKL